MIDRSNNNLAKDECGSAIVEGALLVPVLFIFVFGVFEFSNYFYQQHLMSTGVRDAARYLARTANPNDGATQTDAKNLATVGQTADDGTRRLTGWDPGDVVISIEEIENELVDGLWRYRGGMPVSIIHVTGSMDYAPLGFLEFLGVGSLSISVSHSQRAIAETP